MPRRLWISMDAPFSASFLRTRWVKNLDRIRRRRIIKAVERVFNCTFVMTLSDRRKNSSSRASSRLEKGTPAVDRQDLICGLEGHVSRGQCHPKGPTWTPQDGINARNKFCDRERFDKVVIGPRVQPLDPVVQRVAGRTNDHGRLWLISLMSGSSSRPSCRATPGQE